MLIILITPSDHISAVLAFTYFYFFYPCHQSNGVSPKKGSLKLLDSIFSLTSSLRDEVIAQSAYFNIFILSSSLHDSSRGPPISFLQFLRIWVSVVVTTSIRQRNTVSFISCTHSEGWQRTFSLVPCMTHKGLWRWIFLFKSSTHLRHEEHECRDTPTSVAGRPTAVRCWIRTLSQGVDVFIVGGSDERPGLWKENCSFESLNDSL